jgi:hypothetical protein
MKQIRRGAYRSVAQLKAWYAAPPAVPASQVNPARPHRTDAHKCAWHTFFRRSLLQRCVPADARVDVYLWIRTATIAASMTA